MAVIAALLKNANRVPANQIAKDNVEGTKDVKVENTISPTSYVVATSCTSSEQSAIPVNACYTDDGINSVQFTVSGSTLSLSTYLLSPTCSTLSFPVSIPVAGSCSSYSASIGATLTSLPSAPTGPGVVQK